MIVKFDSVSFIKDKISKQGKRFDCWVMRGTKVGGSYGPDVPYEKMVFETDAITVIEQGITRPGCSLLQFLQKACKTGDQLLIRTEPDGRYRRWCSIEKYNGQRGGPTPTYEPLPDPSNPSQGSEERPAWME